MSAYTVRGALHPEILQVVYDLRTQYVQQYGEEPTWLMLSSARAFAVANAMALKREWLDLSTWQNVLLIGCAGLKDQPLFGMTLAFPDNLHTTGRMCVTNDDGSHCTWD